MTIKNVSKIAYDKNALKKYYSKKKAKLTIAKRKKIEKVFGMWATRSDITDDWLEKGRVNLKSNWKED